MGQGEQSAVATDQSAMRQRPHAVAATAATAAKVTSSVLQRGMRQEASGVCATSEQPSRVPRRDLANRRRYPNYMSTGQQSVDWGEKEREGGGENEATRRLISQFMARSACHGRRRGGWGRLRRGSMNGLVSGREEFGASLAQHMTIKCCTAAAVAVAAANCGKKCRRRPKAAQQQ